MGMDAAIIINNTDYIDAYKGRTNYYYLYSESYDIQENTMKIEYNAEGGYGEIQCGIKIGYTNGNSEYKYIYGYDSDEDRYIDNTTIDMSNVLCVMVYIDSLYGYEDDFDEVFQKELELYEPPSLQNLCAQVIRLVIGEDRLENLCGLNLPPTLIKYIAERRCIRLN